MNTTLLVFYTLELVFRFWVYRFTMLKDAFSLLDLTLVSFDIITLFMDAGQDFMNASILRIVRLAKVSRTFQLLKVVPELHLMIKGLVGAVKAIFWGAILAAFMILIWSILAVSIIHPINQEIAESTTQYVGCERCPYAYASVFRAAVTFTQQIIAGDSWGQVTVPIIEKAPASALFFFGVFASVALATMNLILAVIVDAAQQARAKSTHDLAHEREVDFEKSRKRMLELCSELDQDHNGQLSLAELSNGFLVLPEFADILEVLDIKEDDMPVVFGIMDQDGNGEVSYEEFVKELWKMQSNDLQSMIIYIRFYVTQIRKQLLDHLEIVTSRVLAKIDQEEEQLEKKMEEEEAIMKHIEEQEEAMMQQETEVMKKLDRQAAVDRAPDSQRMPPMDTPKIVKNGEKSNGMETDDIIAKLEAMERTFEQSLSSMRASLQDLSSQVSQDAAHRALPVLRSVASPGPGGAALSYEGEEKMVQSNAWSCGRCATQTGVEGSAANGTMQQRAKASQSLRPQAV
jgi:hypothetical protein